jgi:hypothetical protein
MNQGTCGSTLASRHVDQLTFSAIASLRATPLPPSQIVRYKSFDGKIMKDRKSSEDAAL